MIRPLDSHERLFYVIDVADVIFLRAENHTFWRCLWGWNLFFQEANRAAQSMNVIFMCW